MPKAKIVNGKPHWDFNGDFEKPVFHPSVLQWWGGDGEGDDHIPLYRCHAWVGQQGAKPGEIELLGDSTHEMAGKIVALPDIEF